MTAHILYPKYLDEAKSRVTIGGVQTYITNLSHVLADCGYDVVLYQCARSDYETAWDGMTVIGVNCSARDDKEKSRRMLEICMPRVDKETDVIIFASDYLNLPCPGVRTISIQHGIYWDIPTPKYDSRLRYIRDFIRKIRMTWDIIERCSVVDHLVCVDYNFINWYRSLTPFSRVKLYAIPNFTSIPASLDKRHDGLRLIFARRFFPYRGTRVFADAISRILDEYDIEVIVAGEGPDEKYLKDKLVHRDNVRFTTYQSSESLAMHEKVDIAVIPTVGSEGTSLSLLEAMASKCAVICTNVGGMTNIVLDHYNGIMIEPDSGQLYLAIKELIENRQQRTTLAEKAFETASSSFCFKKWETDWKRLIRTRLR